MAIDPSVIRKDFPMYQNHVEMQGKPLVWLDNASTTFKPYPVIEAIDRYYCYETANSHRGDYDLCYQMDVKIQKAREAIASFINSEANEVVFTSGTTASLNLIAYGFAMNHLKQGDEIIISEAEHASNILPWFNVAKKTGAIIKYMPLSNDGRLTVENLEKTITSRTKFISLAHVGNVLGYVAPIKEMCALAHQHGIIFSLDGAQSVPHLETDVKELDCDFLSFSLHKMCGPTGLGVLYGKYEILKQTNPYEVGGGMNTKFYCSGDVGYLDPPMRFEAGTLNLASLSAVEATVNYLKKISISAINQHESELKRYAVEKLSKNDKLIIYNAESESGIITFNHKDVFAQDLATFLNNHGIACRSGQHCAKVLNDFLQTPATVRASLYMYNSKQDIDALAEALENGGNFLDAFFN